MPDHDKTNKSFDKINHSDEECISARNPDYFIGDNDHGDAVPPGMEIEDIMLRNQYLYERIFSAEMRIGDLIKRNEVLEKEIESMMKKKKNKRPTTRRVSYGKPVYEKDSVPGPYIPFVIQYKPKIWLFGYGGSCYEFLSCLSPYEAVRYFKLKFPKAKIIGVYSLIWDKEFPKFIDTD